jgi:RNA polymerase sigma factor (sigma-70 family)
MSTTAAPFTRTPDISSPCRGLLSNLVIRCGEGDESAIGELFDLTYFLVVRIVDRGPLTSVGADDRVVEAFRRIWQRAPTYQPDEQGVLSWVFDQAHDQARDQAQVEAHVQAQVEAGAAAVALLRALRDVVGVPVAALTPAVRSDLAAAGSTTTPVDYRRQRRDAAQAAAHLSNREVSVLELVSRGLPNQDIAAELYVSVNTVKTYIRSAYRKIGASRRAQAVLWAVHHDLGPPSDSTG